MHAAQLQEWLEEHLAIASAEQQVLDRLQQELSQMRHDALAAANLSDSQSVSHQGAVQDANSDAAGVGQMSSTSESLSD